MSRRMHQIRRSAIVGVALLALAACGGTGTEPKTLATGTYALQTVNGSSLPVTLFSDPSGSIAVVSGGVTIKSGGAFTESLTLRFTDDTGASSTQTLTCNGTYVAHGSTVTFTEPETDECGGTFVGSIAGNQLTMTFDNDFVAVYVRP